MGIGVSLAWLYCRYAPFRRGKQRLKRIAVRVLPGKKLTVGTRYGTRFGLAFPRDAGWEDLVFIGTFETGTTTLMLKLLQAADVVFDIGANIGWYTTLVTSNVPQGVCHAFEPVESTFHELEENCLLNGVADRVHLNMVALGSSRGTLQLHTFAELPHSHSSVSQLGRLDSRPVAVPVDTIDNYVMTHSINKVDLVKLDVEGAEMAVLRGGDTLFDMRPPPAWVVEMNRTTADAAGYKSRDLLSYISSRVSCILVRVERAWGNPMFMQSIDDFEDGDSIFCVPNARHGMQRVLERFVPRHQVRT